MQSCVKICQLLAPYVDKGRVGHAHADVGVDDAGHDTRDPDDEYLTGEADAEPENGKRNPRDGGDGTDKFEDRAEQTFNHVEPAHGQTERDTHDEREHIPDEGFLNGRPRVRRHDGAVGVGVAEFVDERGEHLGGRCQQRIWNDSRAHHAFPEGEKDDDAYVGKDGQKQWLFDAYFFVGHESHPRVCAALERRASSNLGYHQRISSVTCLRSSTNLGSIRLRGRGRSTGISALILVGLLVSTRIRSAT